MNRYIQQEDNVVYMIIIATGLHIINFIISVAPVGTYKLGSISIAIIKKIMLLINLLQNIRIL